MVTICCRVLSNVRIEHPTSSWAALTWWSPRPRRRVLSNAGDGRPTSLWVALLPCSSPLVVIFGSNVRVRQPTSLRAALTWWLPLPCRLVPSNVAVGQPMSLWVAVPRCSTPVVVEWCQRLVLGCHLIVGGPATSFSSPRVVRTSALGSPRRCGIPCHGVRSPSSLCVASNLRIRVPTLFVGSPRVKFTSHGRVVLDVGVGCPTVVFALS